MKRIFTLFLSLAICMSLYGCMPRSVKGTVWLKTEKFFLITLRFSKDGVMTLTPSVINKESQKAAGITDKMLLSRKETFYYTDGFDAHGKRTLRVYKSEKDKNGDKNAKIIPYKIDDKGLHMKKITYTYKGKGE
ncbi:MAG: hypothetical protein Q8873_00890 [Bacillota bacterium]|nr:hypothetical protein [Bacillota bacterium]